MNKNLILFLVLAAAAAIAYFILSAPTEQQAAANGGSTAGGGPTGAGNDPAASLGIATGGNALDGLLTALTTTPNAGIAATVTKLFSYDIPNLGKIEGWGYMKGSGSSTIFEVDYLVYNGNKIVSGTEQYNTLTDALNKYRNSGVFKRPGAN